MSKLKKLRVLAAKHETTVGTAIAVAAADAAFNAYDVETTGEFEYTKRQMQGYFSKLPGSVGNRQGTMTFKIDFTGDGGSSPGWATTLLPACGMIESANTWSPNSAAPLTTTGTGVNHTVTIAAYEDGVKKFLVGAMGNVVFRFVSGKPIVCEFTFTGKWAPPVDAAILAPTLPTNLPVIFADATITIGGVAPGLVNNLVIDLGNEVVLRPDATDATGFHSAAITGRDTKGSWDPESRLVATENVYGLWLAGTEQAFSCAIETGTDDITFAMPQVQRTGIKPGERNGHEVDQIEFDANAVTGDDELTINFN